MTIQFHSIMPYIEVIIDRLMFKSIRKLGVFANFGQFKYMHSRCTKASNFLLLDVELVSPVFCNNATLFNPFGLLTRTKIEENKGTKKSTFVFISLSLLS